MLLEYKGSRRTITCSTSTLRECVLETLGIPGTFSDYILQRYSSRWETFIDIDQVDEIYDGDRITIIPNIEMKVGLVVFAICSYS